MVKREPFYKNEAARLLRMSLYTKKHYTFLIVLILWLNKSDNGKKI